MPLSSRCWLLLAVTWLAAVGNYGACQAFASSQPHQPPAAAAQSPSAPRWFAGTDDHRVAQFVADEASAGTSAGGAVAATTGALDQHIAHDLFSINVIWTLIAAFLVLFMQAGFACVEAGMCRAKNASNTFTMNLMIFPFACFAFWAYGFALGWGNSYHAPSARWGASLGPGLATLDEGLGIGSDADGPGTFLWGLLGTKGFFLRGVEDGNVMALFFFLVALLAVASNIAIGTMAERWRWRNFCLYGLWVALPFCMYANWVWGGGWLAQIGRNWHWGHGAVDFAGSGVVHGMGGVIALTGSIVLGPRIGKFIRGRPQAIPGHSIPLVCLGTLILSVGWFGLNSGSSLAGTDLRISAVAVHTILAAATAALSCMLYLSLRGMKPDPSIMCNGVLAGLVAISAPCAFVNSWGAAIVGLVAGVLVVESIFFWDRLGVDDVVGAISVHGANGLWGLIAVGLFATGQYGGGWNGVDRFKELGTQAARDDWTQKVGYAYDGVRGLFYGDASQLWAQLLACAVLVGFGLVMAYIWFKISNLITPIRVRRDVELEGLDGPEMGALGYPDFAVKSGALDA